MLQLSWRARLLLAAGVLAIASPLAAQEPASNYPAKNVEFVVPFAAGGTADIIARLAAQSVADTLPKPIVVQNRAGATGAIAAEYVMKAPPDGYTLLMVTGSTHTVNPAYRKDLPFDPVKDFTAIARVVVVANVLVVNPKKIPAKTLAEFIDYLKAHPGQLNFGSSGAGGASHFAGELFALMTDTKMTHVPYRGTAPAVADLIAGNIDLLIDNISSVWPMVQQGTLRAIAIASPERSPIAPDLPTIAETLPGYEAVSWNGIAGPAGMPAPLVQKISQAFIAGMKKPEIAKRIEDLGAAVSPQGPAEFNAFIKEDLARWQRVAREKNVFPK
jgi:tripartite-type tricarboxylate transporter receptor subunit TctC